MLKASVPAVDEVPVQLRRPKVAERSRRRVREERRQLLADNRGRLLTAAAFALAFTCAMSFVYWRIVGSEFLAGLFAGTFMTASVAVVLWALELASTAKNDLFGSYGEEATGELFRRWRSRRAGWDVVHNIPFQGRDVDHVAFGPHGVLVIESKWANYPWHVDGDDLDTGYSDPLWQALRNARSIRCLLRGAGIRTDVTPVVIQWGPSGLRDAPWQWHQFDCGVVVVRGQYADRWLDALDTAVATFDGSASKAIRTALKQRKREHDGRPEPMRA